LAAAALVGLFPHTHAFVTSPVTHNTRPTSFPTSLLPATTTTVEGGGELDRQALDDAAAAVAAGNWKARAKALYKFTRPHTIRGTILASIAGTVRALRDAPSFGFSTALLARALVGMVSLLLGNAFIVGINQIYDKSIDQINKPFLPVASGEMSKRAAWVTVISSCILGPVLVYRFFPRLLFRLYAAGLTLGALYSIPPIRTKQNPVAAAVTIALVRGFLLNFGVYYAVLDALSTSFVWSPKVAFVARFMTVFASVIAITKDLPDVEGDEKYEIETFATKLGVKRISQGAVAVLGLNYVHAIVTGVLQATKFNLIPMIGGHVALALLLWKRFADLDSTSQSSIQLFYKHIWDLFYLEYVLYTII